MIKSHQYKIIINLRNWKSNIKVSNNNIKKQPLILRQQHKNSPCLFNDFPQDITFSINFILGGGIFFPDNNLIYIYVIQVFQIPLFQHSYNYNIFI